MTSLPLPLGYSQFLQTLPSHSVIWTKKESPHGCFKTHTGGSPEQISNSSQVYQACEREMYINWYIYHIHMSMHVCELRVNKKTSMPQTTEHLKVLISKKLLWWLQNIWSPHILGIPSKKHTCATQKAVFSGSGLRKRWVDTGSLVWGDQQQKALSKSVILTGGISHISQNASQGWQLPEAKGHSQSLKTMAGISNTL